MYTEWDGSLRLLDLKTEEMMRLLELLSRRCKNWTDPTMKSWPSPLMTLVCSWRRWTGSGSKEDVWKKRWKMNQQIRKNVGPGMRTMCFWCATILTHCANQQFSENLSWDVGWQTAALLPRKPDWASERASPSPVATVGEKRSRCQWTVPFCVQSKIGRMLMRELATAYSSILYHFIAIIFWILSSSNNIYIITSSYISILDHHIQ